MLLLLGSGLAWAFAPFGELTLIRITISLRLRIFTVNFVARVDDLILEHGHLLLDRRAISHILGQRRTPLFDDVDAKLQVGLMAANLLVARTTPLRHYFFLLQR